MLASARPILIGALIALAAVPAVAKKDKVFVDYDHDIDFSKYETFAYVEAKRLFPEASWGRVHLQMIFFGREHCPARGHDLASCPICSWAASKRRMAQEAAPRRPTCRKGPTSSRGCAAAPAPASAWR